MNRSARQLVRLRKFYKIKGDGVAQLNLADAVTDAAFKRTLGKMSRMRVDKEDAAEEVAEAAI